MARNPVHGTTYSYRLGCRCDLCAEAKHLDWLRYRREHPIKIRRSPVIEPSPAMQWFEGMDPEEVILLTATAFYLMQRDNIDIMEATDMARKTLIPDGLSRTDAEESTTLDS